MSESPEPWKSRCPGGPPPDAPSEDESVLFQELERSGIPRRDFLKIISYTSAGVFGMQLMAGRKAYAEAASIGEGMTVGTSTGSSIPVNLSINGAKHALNLDPRVTLLDALRERLDLTGTKKGCDHGQCGACTVMVDGKRVLSCLTLAAQVDGKEVTTIEGLATDERLHPMQEAFIEHDGFQCGYCTSGQICSAVALLEEAKKGDASFVTMDLKASSIELSDDEIRERMSGNICRCAAYPQILAAIRDVHSGHKTAATWGFASEDELALIRKEFDHETV